MRLSRLLPIAVSLSLAGGAMAAEPYRLAFSDKLGVEVYANPDSAGAWCRPALSLSLLVKEGSPLLQGGIDQFIPRLAPVFEQQCPGAASAVIAAYRAADRALIGPPLTARKEANWATAPAQVQAQAQARPPAALREQAENLNYWSLFARYAGLYPADAGDRESRLGLIAAQDCKGLSRVYNNEFQLAEFLKAAEPRLQETAAKPYLRIFAPQRLGEYDIAQQKFRFEPLPESPVWAENYTFCGGAGSHRGKIQRFAGVWKGGPIVDMPLPAAEAESFINNRNQRHYGSREVMLEVILRPTFSAMTPEGVARVELEMLEATVFADRDMTRTLHVYGEADLRDAAQTAATAAAAKAEARRQSERRNQAEADVRMLGSAGKGARTAYLHDGSRALSRVTPALGESLISGKPVPVVFLVQAAADGSREVAAKWPGRLSLTLAEGLPALKAAHWYVVSGTLNATQPADKPLLGQVAVRAATECSASACAESDDVAGLVRRRYPDLQWPANPPAGRN